MHIRLSISLSHGLKSACMLLTLQQICTYIDIYTQLYQYNEDWQSSWFKFCCTHDRKVLRGSKKQCLSLETCHELPSECFCKEGSRAKQLPSSLRYSPTTCSSDKLPLPALLAVRGCGRITGCKASSGKVFFKSSWGSANRLGGGGKCSVGHTSAATSPVFPETRGNDILPSAFSTKEWKEGLQLLAIWEEASRSIFWRNWDCCCCASSLYTSERCSHSLWLRISSQLSFWERP